MDYEREIEIDESQLDVEWLEQAGKFREASKYEAECKYELALAHENVKLVRSQLIKEVAEDKAYSNAVKIEAYYRTHPDHIKAKERFIEAEFQANLASGNTSAFRMRKDSLENLTRLVLADYFARPSEPRDLTEVMKNRYAKDKEQARESAKQEAGIRAKRKLSKRK